MKILLFILALPLAFAEDFTEVSDGELNRKFISVARDVEIENLIQGSNEFQACAQQAKISPSDDENERRRKARQAETCFARQMGSGRASEERLREFSQRMGLQTYGLVASDNVKEVTKYLQKKMYKNLTGVDLDEQDTKKMLEQMKFGRKKMLDQKDFLKMYKTQHVKNALFEVSRFCFEDLRRDITPPTAPTDFADHWGAEVAKINDPNQWDSVNVTDLRDISFGSNLSTGSKEGTLSNLLESVTASNPAMDSAFMGKFFGFCTKKMRKLCEGFREGIRNDARTAGTPTIGGATAVRGRNGPKACLAVERLANIRKSISAADQIMQDFSRIDGPNMVILLERGADPNMYKGGRGQNEKSIDEITSVSSADFLQVETPEMDQLAQRCKDTPGGADCDRFLVEDDSRAQIEFKTGVEYHLKKQAELELINKMSRASLEEYLTQQGYLDLAEDARNNKSMSEIQEKLSAHYDARREALLAKISKRLGNRQASSTEISREAAKAGTSEDQEREKRIRENAQAALQEKARLAQLVMFNNIISSSVSLNKADGTQVGRNINALRAEVAGLEQNQVEESLFENLKTSLTDNDTNGNSTPGEIQDAGFLDQILGKNP